MSFDRYVYPGTNVLKNKPDIVDPRILDAYERVITSRNMARLRVRGITGRFDISHLKALHRELFGEFYDWAGEFRDIMIYKGGTEFTAPDKIYPELNDLRMDIRRHDYFRGMSRQEAACGLADVMCRLNFQDDCV